MASSGCCVASVLHAQSIPAAEVVRTACSSKLETATESSVGCKEERSASTCARTHYAVARRRRHRDEVGVCDGHQSSGSPFLAPAVMPHAMTQEVQPDGTTTHTTVYSSRLTAWWLIVG